MTLSIVLFCAAAIILVLIPVLNRRKALPKTKLPAPVAVAMLVVTGVLIFGASAKAWRDPHEEAVKRRQVAMDTIPQVLKTLPVGSPFPEIPSAGWLFGSPRPAVGEPARLRVVDVWSMWCPMVTKMAPGMATLHRRYAAKGVEFIGVTDDTEDITALYAKRYDLHWPTAYGIPKNKIGTFGVLRPDLPGEKPYIAPTLYLLGADGRVLWSDGGGRFHHRETGQNLAELAREIDKALLNQLTSASAQADGRSRS